MTSPRYIKLPGHGRTWTGVSRIWLGEDHVLLVLGKTFSETYRRFFFNDIQGIIVRRTNMGKMWNGIWGSFVILFGVLALAVGGVAAIVLSSLAAPFLIALLWNVALGPTCVVHVRTAVQTERVPALGRIRAAKQFIARIEPLIITAQGQLAADQSMMEIERFQTGVISTIDTTVASGS